VGVELDDPGSVGKCNARLAPLGDQPTADGPREQRGGAAKEFDLAFLKLRLPGVAYEDQCSPRRAVGDECAAELWTEARGCQQVTKTWASLRVTTGRISERRGLALSVGELLELVDILDRVLVVRQNREAVRNVLEPVLGDQVRSGVQRVPARSVERDGTLEPDRGLVKELRTLRGTKRETFEIGKQPLWRPTASLGDRVAPLPGRWLRASVPPRIRDGERACRRRASTSSNQPQE
jgi:hypothetical protein